MTKHSTQSTSVLWARSRFSVVGALLSSAVSSKGHASSYVPPLSSTVIPPRQRSVGFECAGSLPSLSQTIWECCSSVPHATIGREAVQIQRPNQQPLTEPVNWLRFMKRCETSLEVVGITIMPFRVAQATSDGSPAFSSLSFPECVWKWRGLLSWRSHVAA